MDGSLELHFHTEQGKQLAELPSDWAIEGDKSRRVSPIRRWMGDENIETITFYDFGTPKRLIIEAFPEADIYLCHRPD